MLILKYLLPLREYSNFTHNHVHVQDCLYLVWTPDIKCFLLTFNFHVSEMTWMCFIFNSFSPHFTNARRKLCYLRSLRCLHVTINLAFNSVYTIQTNDYHESALFTSKEPTGLRGLSCGILVYKWWIKLNLKTIINFTLNSNYGILFHVVLQSHVFSFTIIPHYIPKLRKNNFLITFSKFQAFPEILKIFILGRNFH